ncbi:flagellar protein FlgN [Desulfosarcina sp.]|uniref:flagellar protein FlgN n=1 Tax=Desulfosarcina sp. TaxID=2027861 RepID=UPI0029AFE40D|nr:flagellar protein FlgN [Desulfosarcina sp.]MDX2454181.1 flagellar protein FlgN [Desulfosarcina sp.]
MHAKIMKLLDILDEEAACYRDMKSVLSDEEASISLARKERFDRVQLEKESLLVKIQQYEKMRVSLVDQLADAYQVDEPIVTVSKLARYLSAPYYEKLLFRANRLRSRIVEVQLKNKHNQQLIRQYLELIKGALKLLNRLIYDNSVYQKPGTRHPAMGYRGSGGRIFCKTV